MGIINLTPDSFSDGGDFFSIEKALLQVEKFVIAGVDIVDIGAQSTRPGADEISPNEEINRLIPTLKMIREKFPRLLISVDTFSSKVAKEGLLNGANWINDVTGGKRDEKILDIVSEFNCPYVITHSKGNSKNMNKLSIYDNLLEDVLDELKKQTEKALIKDIKKENIVWDPGLGFAKDTTQNILILKNLNLFMDYGYPILIGASRKRFIGDILNINEPKERDIGTLAISCLCSQLGVQLIRVHNVELNSTIIKMSDTISRP